ncbi:hypothetical protein [Bacillus dakarensis]|uniref:hypothetical protein n=1 Tax=Robertmurraya dakarensis TaxID=1926278 RepID=UPI000980C6D4|nr:hypothetical protein [Bacillus dakarensis]
MQYYRRPPAPMPMRNDRFFFFGGPLVGGFLGGLAGGLLGTAFYPRPRPYPFYAPYPPYYGPYGYGGYGGPFYY